MGTVREFFDDFLDTTVVFGYDRIGYSVRKPLWDTAETEASMKGKRCVISGANSGLGKATTHHLARLGAEIHMLCRNPELGQQALDEIQAASGNTQMYLHQVDMSSQESIQAFCESFSKEHSRVDILINNAGVLLNDRQESVDGIEKSFATNVLGYFILTQRLHPLLAKAEHARVINVSSGGMYFSGLELDDPEFKTRDYDGVQAYSEAKRAEVVLTQIWAQAFKDDSIFVAAMHPGWADTKGVQQSLPGFRRLTQSILRNAEQGADTIIWLAVNPNLSLEQSGKFWFDRKPRRLYRKKNTKVSSEQAQDFWKLCSQYSKLDVPLEQEVFDHV